VVPDSGSAERVAEFQTHTPEPSIAPGVYTFSIDVHATDDAGGWRTSTTFKTRMSEQAVQAVQERFVGIETEYDF
jgi:hypothetical protein